jgi:uncharacterized membrane protein YagU involved in acid resistance
MLPHKHFLISGLTIFLAAILLFPEKSVIGIGKWVLIGGLLSSAIDLDIYILVLLKSGKEDRLKPFRNPLGIYRNFESFMDTIFKTGLWKIGLVTHLAFSALLILLPYIFSSSYFVPVALGVISHIITDIPNLRMIIK